MATYDLEEQEQLDELKAWWKQYGNLVVNVLTVAAVVVIAWQGWKWYQRNQSAQASMVYAVLQKAVHENDAQRITAASGDLLEKFGGSDYAALGALTAAKAMIDAGDAKTAKLKLIWVVEHGKHEVRELARLRLAALLLDEKAYDEALKRLDGNVRPAFAARFAEARGDVLVAQGKKEEAVSAYQTALSELEKADKAEADGAGVRGSASQSNVIYRDLLQQKTDSLGGGK